MKVRMLQMYSTSPDGIHVDLYKAGQKYDLPDFLAVRFFDMGIAVSDKDMETAPEMKMSVPRKTKRRK
jgi:hypothetical protein